MSKIHMGVALPYNSAKISARLAKLAEEHGWEGCFLGDAIWCEDPMIALAAAATTTQHIRLGTMIIPVPLRRPEKIASESVALDYLSEGRLTLGLGTGAVWMGWQAFPDYPKEAKIRGEMLDETIDILTLMYQHKQFDYEGKHYHIKLTAMDEQYYPPKPVQQPRIPLWAVGIWPSRKSIKRALKCDGIILEKVAADGKNEDFTPADIQAIKAIIAENRTDPARIDLVMGGNMLKLPSEEAIEKLNMWQEAGITWWIEGLWEQTEEQAIASIQKGPPQL
jgi:alkanesulfonate monooxygenase SsuD/methylene tetrahydromethanopterin reductase-like flavin-dependent oxidoreductase (luciferase family)